MKRRAKTLETIHAIALIDGYKQLPNRKWVYVDEDNDIIGFDQLPDYYGSLDAMFRVEEKYYKTHLWNVYSRNLWLIGKHDTDAPIHANAAQRATALFHSLKNPPKPDPWPFIETGLSKEPLVFEPITYKDAVELSKAFVSEPK